MILNTPPQARAFRSYEPSLLHMYLTGEGWLERVCRRGSVEEGLSKRVRWKGSMGEGPLERVCWRGFDGEGPLEKICRRRSVGEDGCRKRGLTLEPTMTLIPCEMREENNTFLY